VLAAEAAVLANVGDASVWSTVAGTPSFATMGEAGTISFAATGEAGTLSFAATGEGAAESAHQYDNHRAADARL
jgi:hypothetical protein